MRNFFAAVVHTLPPVHARNVVHSLSGRGSGLHGLLHVRIVLMLGLRVWAAVLCEARAVAGFRVGDLKVKFGQIPCLVTALTG